MTSKTLTDGDGDTLAVVIPATIREVTRREDGR